MVFDAFPDRFVGVIARHLTADLPSDVIARAAKLLELFLDAFPESVQVSIDLPLNPIFEDSTTFTHVGTAILSILLCKVPFDTIFTFVWFSRTFSQ
jgi:hypothetical protein